MRKTGLRSTGIAAALGAVAMSCCVASAQMGEMPGMHHHHAPNGEKLGSVSFPVSCDAASKVPMERGIALLHSFGYEEAAEQFTELTKSDPTCAMAHWGVAMSGFHELWEHPAKAAMDRGWEEIRQARKIGATTERERMYIAALSSFYDPAKRTDYQARVDAYTAGMLALHQAYPADVEASAFYALSLLADVGPDDTSLVKERKALGVLVPLFEKNPGHPGLAHYIIHTCDTPKLAQQGLPAAEKYALIASSSPHALHMPGHIFARLGMWPEDIDSNLASVAASEKAEAAGIPGTHHRYHAEEFLLYAYLQTGQDGKAKQLLDRVNPLADRLDAMLADLQKSPYADMMPRFQLYRTEIVAWQQYAEGQNDAAVATMRKAADEQDKLGQAEVDLPAREMLGDMLMELNRPKEALVEYKVALTLSPNRLNGLYGAGRAAEALGTKKEAGEYYAAMLKNTDNGAYSSRPSLAHAKAVVAGKTVALQ